MPLEPSASPTLETPAATPATEPASGNGTASSNGSDVSVTPPGSATPSEDTFLSGDVNALPPELRKHYDNMLTDYKKKTQAIAEERKRLPDLEKKAKSYDDLTSDQRFKEYWSDLDRKERSDFRAQKAEAEKRIGEKISDVEFAKAWETKDGFLELIQKVVEDKRTGDQKEIQELKQKVGLNEAADAIESVASEMDKGTKQPIRPDFYELDEDKLITGYLSVNPARSPKEYRDKAIEAYNWAKSVKSKFFEQGKAEALKVIQTKSQNSSEPPTVTSKGSYTGPDPKKVDVSEAVALARKGIRVPHN